MNKQNIELIRRHMRLEEQGDSDAVLDDMVDPPSYYLAAADAWVHGRAGVQEIHRSLNARFPVVKIEIKAVGADDTNGFAEVVVSGTLSRDAFGHKAGTWVCNTTASIFEFKDGKIACERVYSIPNYTTTPKDGKGKRVAS